MRVDSISREEDSRRQECSRLRAASGNAATPCDGYGREWTLRQCQHYVSASSFQYLSSWSRNLAKTQLANMNGELLPVYTEIGRRHDDVLVANVRVDRVDGRLVAVAVAAALKKSRESSIVGTR